MHKPMHAPKPTQYLAFDFGLKRIGVAFGNSLTKTASGVAVVQSLLQISTGNDDAISKFIAKSVCRSDSAGQNTAGAMVMHCAEPGLGKLKATVWADKMISYIDCTAIVATFYQYGFCAPLQ